MESQNPQELDAWVKARRHLPTFERHGHPPKSRITVEGSMAPAFARFSELLTVVAGMDFDSVAQIVDMFQRWFQPHVFWGLFGVRLFHSTMIILHISL